MALCNSQVSLMLSKTINITETTYSCQFQYEFGNQCVRAVKVSNFTGHYLLNRSTLDIGVLGFFVIVQHTEHPPEVWSVPPVTPCIAQTGQHVCSTRSSRATCCLRQNVMFPAEMFEMRKHISFPGKIDIEGRKNFNLLIYGDLLVYF